MFKLTLNRGRYMGLVALPAADYSPTLNKNKWDSQPPHYFTNVRLGILD